MIHIITISLIYLAFLAFSAKRSLTYLHYYQQEEYDSPRFLGWMIRGKIFDTRLSLLIVIISFCALIIPVDFLIYFACVLAFGVISVFEADPRTKSKKKLVMTGRAKRIFMTAMIFAALLGTLPLLLDSVFLWLITIHAVPFLLILANMVLDPYEKATQKRFWNEAHEKLLALEPFTIGITGSFGKTSVKHILGHILQGVAPTLITPGSVNTQMGIARIIREQLTDQHKYFVCEMGAYGPGSIAGLCRLVPPHMAIITAIGHAHYERFKTLETVAQAKFELAEAAFEKDGKAIVHDTTLTYPRPQNMLAEKPDSFVICGKDKDHHLRIGEIMQSRTGLRVKVIWQGKDYKLEAPLYGAHHGINIALSFAAACSMGIEPDTVIALMKTAPQIAHRLEVKKTGKNGLIIDDAYNSNPQGFMSALDLMDHLSRKDQDAPARRILITPGMVEMGAAHDKSHAQLGHYALEKTDVVLVVAPERIQSFVMAYKNGKRENQTLLEMPSFGAAQRWLQYNEQEGDIILLENDLPDLYERRPKI